MNLDNNVTASLIAAALSEREKAYAPYSGFQVGAALLAGSGKIYTGCNVENASYAAAACAERIAFYRALHEDEHDFLALAVAGGQAGGPPAGYCFPCGICRQVIREFCRGDFPVVIARSAQDYTVTTLDELLPNSFGPENLR